MARPKKPKPRLPTLEEQLADHMRDAPTGPDGDAYEQAYRRSWVKRRNELQDAIRHRDAKRVVDDTVEVVADDPEDTKKRRKNLTRVRQSEAWRHNRLTGMQRDAEKEMEFAWRQRTAGLGAAVSKYGLQRGGSGRADLGSSADEAWLEWNRLAQQRRILVAAVIDCLAEPKTLTEVEQTHRMRRGQAFDNYVLALDLWCEVRGWVRGPRMDGGGPLGGAPHLAAEGVTR